MKLVTSTPDHLPTLASTSFLQEVLVQSESAERAQRLIRWEEAPDARPAHPPEEHFIPLILIVGAVEEEPGACVYHEAAFL